MLSFRGQAPGARKQEALTPVPPTWSLLVQEPVISSVPTQLLQGHCFRVTALNYYPFSVPIALYRWDTEQESLFVDCPNV